MPHSGETVEYSLREKKINGKKKGKCISELGRKDKGGKPLFNKEEREKTHCPKEKNDQSPLKRNACSKKGGKTDCRL